MFKSLTKIEIRTILTIAGAIVSATVFLTTLSVRQIMIISRIESIERGNSLEENKNKAVQEFELAVTQYKNLEIPTGSIIPFFGSDIPPGFLLCDGSQFPKSKAPKLYDFFKTQAPELITDSDIALLPNLKGMFLRGAGREINGNKVSVVGQIEGHNAGFHIHQYSRVTQLFGSHNQGAPGNGWADVPESGDSGIVRSGEGGNSSNKFGAKLKTEIVDTHSPQESEKETRPINTSVNFIIKI